MEHKKQSDDRHEPLREGVRLIAGNIKFTSGPEPIIKELREYAKIIDFHLPAGTGMQNKGYALFRAAAEGVEKLLNATVIVDGRILRIQRAR